MIERKICKICILMFFSLLSHPVFAEWRTVCDEKRCQLYQQIIRQSDKQLMSQLFFQKLRDEDGHLKDQFKNFVTPNSIYGVLLLSLGLHIPSGVTVAIDDKLSFPVELIHCKPAEGCRAVFIAQDAAIELMKRGNKFVVEIVDSDTHQRINFTFTLTDFTEAFKEFHEKPL